jgi:Kdo2-lipid IVA lauroyltransferase/acyltransferase
MIGLVRLLGLVPLSLAQAFGRALGRVLYARRTRAREVARVNLQLVYPHLEEDKREQLLQQTLLHNGMAGAEMGTFWGRDPGQLQAQVMNIHHPEVLEQALACDKGVLIMAPHIGNWELLNSYLARRCDITIMFKPAKNPVFSNWMHKRREASGARLVPTTATGVRALFKTLQKGGVAGFLPDQEPERRSGLIVPFMGVPTLTPRMPFELIQRTGAKAIMAACIRRPQADGFDLHFLEVDAQLYSADAEVACAALNRSVEQVVALAPEQYQWTYKRFKRQQEGTPSPYNVARVP